MKIEDVTKRSTWIPTEKCLNDYPSMKGGYIVVMGFSESEVHYNYFDKDGDMTSDCNLYFNTFSEYFIPPSPIPMLKKSFDRMRKKF